MRLYRLTPKKYAGDTSGEGSKRKGGRWNPTGSPVHYTSSSAALAVLEFLVHVDPDCMPPMKLITYEIPDDLVVEFIGELPAGWQDSPPPKTLADAGAQWLESQETLALKVPAVLFPDGPDTNILVNPLHPDMHKLTTLTSIDFSFDQRLLDKKK